MLMTVMAMIASVLYSSYREMPRKETGSFEYVRKGEDLLDAGKFRESIKYFEKAHASSPANNTIAWAAANAYTRYGNYLAESKDYDKAIDCLARACDIKPSSSTMQNLAIMYSRKAVSEAHDNNLVNARADFENARGAAADSAMASKGLSVSLFNDAVTEHKAGKDDLAVMLLKESSLAYRSSPALEFLGDIYYKKTEFEKARFYYGKALALEPQNALERGKLQKVTKELRLAKREESKSYAHFELRYDKGLAVDAGSIEDLLERCYFDVGGDLKYFPNSKTIVFFYSQDDFKNIFKLSSATRSFYDGNIHIPLPDRTLNAGRFSDYIYHEYTHAVVSAMTNNNCPAWLNEGLAMREEYKDRDTFIAGIFSRMIGKTRLSLALLYTAFDSKDESEEDLAACYLLSYSVVKYVIDNWGMGGLRNLLARIRDGQHVVNAIEDELLLSEKEFERRWKIYVIKKYLKKAA